MIFYEEEYEEVDPYDDMLADDEDFIQTYLSKKFGVTKRENFMEFMKNASEYLENDWYRIYCVEKLKDPDFVDVQFVISDYEIYETAKLVCMTEPNSDEYKQALLHFEMRDDGSDVDFLRLLDVMGYMDKVMEEVNTIEDLKDIIGEDEE